MKLSEFAIGDCIRITYGECFVKEGTIITKLSNGIVLQTDNNHQIFLPKEFLMQDVNIDIIKKSSETIIIEEMVKVNWQTLEEAKCGDKLVDKIDVYTIESLGWGALTMSRDNLGCANICWLQFDTYLRRDREAYLIRKVTTE